MSEFELDTIIEFSDERLRDDFMIQAVTDDSLEIQDENLHYYGDMAILLPSSQAEKLVTLTQQFQGKQTTGLSQPNMTSSPPRTYQEMVESWNALMDDLKKSNTYIP